MVMMGAPLVTMDKSCKSLVEVAILNPQTAGSGPIEEIWHILF